MKRAILAGVILTLAILWVVSAWSLALGPDDLDLTIYDAGGVDLDLAPANYTLSESESPVQVSFNLALLAQRCAMQRIAIQVLEAAPHTDLSSASFTAKMRSLCQTTGYQTASADAPTRQAGRRWSG
jgi:hypothetical protein